ncbi:MFS transporter [Nonomuraea antimicrobica]|uniref:MFS transporter n=1 Tax=Nonomuraea antimicrobica TaxID=561173 RepID=A0ABP7CWM7_9ACTN
MRVLRSSADFRLLWLGSSLSLVGDGMTFVALTWLVLDQPGGTGRLGLLTVCHTLPVFVGGLLTGPLLDRFDKRHVLAADSLVRGAAMASIPLAAAFGEVPHALPYVVAAVYGLFKMVPLAGFPAAIPDLVAEKDRDAANALESISFSVAGMAGPALGGLLIGWFGSEAVLAFDAATFVVFAAAALAVRRPLRAGERPHARSGRLSPLLRDRVLISTTLAFMAFNIATGMLLVTGPWLAKTQLDGGAQALGLLLAALSIGELIGSVLAGARPAASGGVAGRVTAIAVVQLLAAAAFLAVQALPYAGFLLVGLFSAPMTVWAQSLRMRRIPAHLRGRGFAILRTLMQATPPAGAALVTPLLEGGRLLTAVMVMAALAGIPALALLASQRAADR